MSRWSRRRALLPVAVLLVLTAATYTYGLTASGWGNGFYAAAAQAGSTSWKAFFYGSSDGANSITIDKPPASLWVMATSVRLFGLGPRSILLPQVAMGVGTVAAVYAALARVAGRPAGLLAGLVVASTPVAVLMFRYDNPDALLTLLMALAAWATLRAIEHGSARCMVLVGVLAGLGFLAKALESLLVVPACALAYLVAAPVRLRRRLGHLVLAGLALAVSAGWWVAVVALAPASTRPWIGSSRTNSVWEVILGYNGLGRLTGQESAPGSAGSAGSGGTVEAVGQWGSTGPFRLFKQLIGPQVSWLLPAAVLLLAAGLVWRGRAPRTDARRAAYLLFGAWLLVAGATFSLMSGIFHSYYTVALVPAVGALVGLGVSDAWRRWDLLSRRLTLVVALIGTVVLAEVFLRRTPRWGPTLGWLVLALGLGAAVLLLLASRGARRPSTGPKHTLHPPGEVCFGPVGWFEAVAIGLALVAALVGPVTFSAATLARPHYGTRPDAGPLLPGSFDRPPQVGPEAPLQNGRPADAVVAAVSGVPATYTWPAAVIGSEKAAWLQLASRRPVMPIGGFTGTDPSPTLAQFREYVSAGRIRYFAPGGPPGWAAGDTGTAGQIQRWVEARFTRTTIGGWTFYDLTAAT